MKTLCFIIISIFGLSLSPNSVAACPGGGSPQQEDLGRLLLKDNYSSISCSYLGQPYSFEGNQAHAGIDYPVPVGRSVYAPVSGVYNSSSTEILGKACYIILSNGKRLFIHHMKNLIYGYRDTGEKIGEIFDDHVHAELRVGYSGAYLVGGASCGGTCTLEDIEEKTDDPSEVVSDIPSLSSGVSVNGSVSQGHWNYYTITSDSSHTQLTVELYGLSDDLDLYVRKGRIPGIESGEYDSSSEHSGTTSDTCTLGNTGTNDWYIGVFGYRTGNFTVKATLSSGGGTGCTTYRGTLSAGDEEQQPNGTYYWSAAYGTHKGILSGPSGKDFDLRLYKWNETYFYWYVVGKGITYSSNETVSVSGSAGYYTWVVNAFSGSGSYSLCISHP
jgi:hypothetical protein